MADCIECGENFDTERAMKLHHYHSHGESIAKQETECINCDSSFEYYPSEKEGMYCSSCVENGANSDIERMGDSVWWGKSGEDNGNYSGGEKVVCDNEGCTEEKTVSPSELENQDHHFCGKDCYTEWLSNYYSGSGNPLWKGGYETDYGDGWWSARKKARIRDDGECVLCGREKSKHGAKCDVHHIKPVRSFDNKEDAHVLENLVTLCRSCHSAVESGEKELSDVNDNY
jgi:hypothetical protein